MLRVPSFMALLLAASGAACGPQDCAESDAVWAGDAEAFFADYCLECHSSALAGDDRNDAPEGVDFDTYALLAAQDLEGVATQIELGYMPSADAAASPTPDQRDRVVTWLRCGAREE